MTEPIAFPSSTPNLGLPLLFAGQAQKEFFVNQALVVVDALSPKAVTGSMAEPPADVTDGECYRVTAPSAEPWITYPDHIAVAIGGSWHFVAPTEGMMVFDRSAGHWLCYRAGWNSAPTPAVPANVGNVDAEARAALQELIAALQTLGLLAPATL